jgi:D-arabinose 1-dehydrogenase-like Zn-dependent alcohol dehydrogenase
LAWPWIAATQKKRFRLLALETNKGLERLKELFEAGVVPVIEGPYALSDVPEAFRRFEKGLHKGKMVVTVVPSAPAASGTIPS